MTARITNRPPSLPATPRADSAPAPAPSKPAAKPLGTSGASTFDNTLSTGVKDNSIGVKDNSIGVKDNSIGVKDNSIGVKDHTDRGEGPHHRGEGPHHRREGQHDREPRPRPHQVRDTGALGAAEVPRAPLLPARHQPPRGAAGAGGARPRLRRREPEVVAGGAAEGVLDHLRRCQHPGQGLARRAARGHPPGAPGHRLDGPNPARQPLQAGDPAAQHADRRGGDARPVAGQGDHHHREPR